MSETSAGSRGVLLVDDEPAFRERVREAVADTPGLSVTADVGPDVVVDGGTATGPAAVDAVLCGDPGPVDVAALIERLRESRAGAPVFLLAPGDGGALEAGLAAGAEGCFPRVATPAQYDLIAERLAEVEPEGGRSRRAREALEAMEDVVVLAEADLSRVRYVNAAYEEVYGRPLEALYEEPTSFLDAVHPDDRDAYEADMREMIDDFERDDPEPVYEGTYRLRRDGETRWIDVTRYPIVEGGAVERFVAVIEDVTDREELERTYREVFENVSDGLVVHDPDTGEMLDVNQRFCEINGYGREELVGESVGLITADGEYSYEEARERIERAREEGPQLFEWRNERADGETVPVEVHLSVASIRGEERVLASVRDITERRRRERELREAEERFRAVTEHVNEVIFITRGVLSFDPYERPPEGREVEFVSPAFERIFGMPVEDVYEDASAYQEPIHPDDLPDYRGMLERIAADEEAGETRESYESEFRVQHPDRGTRWVHVTTYPTPTDETEAYRLVGIMEDVTERKERERVVAQLHDATERVQDADTAEAVAEATVEAARDVLDLPMTACWLRGEGDALEPVAYTEPVEEIDPASFEPGDLEYDAFEAGEAMVYDPSERFPDNPLDAAIIVPLGSHGVLAAGAPGADAYEEYVLDAGRTLAGHATTALERVSRTEALRESERRFRLIAERLDEVIYLADESLSEVLYVNPAYEAVYGRPVEELYDDAQAFIEAIHPDDEAAYRESFEAMLEDIERGDPRDAYDFEFRIERPDGAVRWIEATGYPILGEDGPHRFVGIAEDVTEERERERRLETFHEATRRLTEADSRSEASRLAVDAAEEVLELPHVSVHLYDEAEGVLEPLAATDALEERWVEAPAFPPGENLPWQAFVDGESVRRSEVEGSGDVYGGGVPDPDLILPLGAHGVMLVGAPDSPSPAERVELAQVLAATVQAALNHVEGERELEARERELEAQVERVERLDRLNTVIRDIEQATVEGSTRDAIEREVCDRLTEVDPYRAAWIGVEDPEPGSIAVRASAGEAGYVERLALGLEGEADDGLGAHPAVAALQEGAVSVRRAIATDTPHADWQKRALRQGHQAVIAAPLAHEGTVYGVLSIAADSPAAFEDEERDVIGELGRSIGHELGVLERQRALESDTTTELEFRVEDEGLRFVGLSAQRGCRVELERSIRRAEGPTSAFYTVEGAPPEALAEAAAAAEDVTDATVVSRDGTRGLLEVRSTTWFGAPFTERGGVVRTAMANDGEGRLAVEIPGRVDTRAVVEGFRERYPESEVLAKRDRERSVRTLLELQDVLEEQLTGRQLETLETAYSAGYFEWPRDASGEEIAELLGITQPTFNKHLRAAERKTFTVLLDREDPADQYT